RGEILIQHAINLLQPVCKSILVSSNNQGYGKFGCPVVTDEILNCGPLGGIYSALKKSTTDWSFVISVDCPFVTKEFIYFLSSEVKESDCLIPKHSSGLEPLVAFYHKKSIAMMEVSIMGGDFKVHNFIENADSKIIDVQDYVVQNPQLFKNLNSQEDLLAYP
ncbi:hypothetical protein MNBD_BACTEROID01-2799, partial [hydrothermal vent metagenome]